MLVVTSNPHRKIILSEVSRCRGRKRLYFSWGVFCGRGIDRKFVYQKHRSSFSRRICLFFSSSHLFLPASPLWAGGRVLRRTAYGDAFLRIGGLRGCVRVTQRSGIRRRVVEVERRAADWWGVCAIDVSGFLLSPPPRHSLLFLLWLFAVSQLQSECMLINWNALCVCVRETADIWLLIKQHRAGVFNYLYYIYILYHYNDWLIKFLSNMDCWSVPTWVYTFTREACLHMHIFYRPPALYFVSSPHWLRERYLFNSILFICIAHFHKLQIGLRVLYNLYTYDIPVPEPHIGSGRTPKQPFTGLLSLIEGAAQISAQALSSLHASNWEEPLGQT